MPVDTRSAESLPHLQKMPLHLAITEQDGLLSTQSRVCNVTPETMGKFARKYAALGARIVGGCCGSSPEHVAAIAKAIKG